MGGKVYIVGAGPGDEKLITLKGIECIQRADLIVFDRQVNPRILRYAKAEAELVDAGKMPDCHALSQSEINRLIIRGARSGKIVARVKGGDPFVFGRGGEEAESLGASGIEFEIIPGITEAASAYTGIPVTHRDYCSSFHVITGHEQPGKPDSPVDYRELAGLSGTLVFLMGVKNLPDICDSLSAYGKSPNTPVAVIEKGTIRRQRVVTGTLHEIVAKVREANIQSPAVTVIGEVVSLQNKLRRYPAGPLAGIRILVTRAWEQAGKFVEKIETLGGEAIEFPVMKMVLPDDFTHFDDCIQNIAGFQWLVFTSINGVKGFFNRLKTKHIDIRQLHNIKLAAVGEATGDSLKELGFQVDFTPESYTTKNLLEGLISRFNTGDRVLLARADIAGAEIPDGLKGQGLKTPGLKAQNIKVEDLVVYRTVADPHDRAKIIKLLQNGDIDYITFTSASTVRNFISIIGLEQIHLANRCPIICIGPITEQEAYQSGLHVADVADRYTIDGLVDKLISRVQRIKELTEFKDHFLYR
jgi:uroporphyrinogen III methyltransferase/synthase